MFFPFGISLLLIITLLLALLFPYFLSYILFAIYKKPSFIPFPVFAEISKKAIPFFSTNLLTSSDVIFHSYLSKSALFPNKIIIGSFNSSLILSNQSSRLSKLVLFKKSKTSIIPSTFLTPFIEALLNISFPEVSQKISLIFSLFFNVIFFRIYPGQYS